MSAKKLRFAAQFFCSVACEVGGFAPEF